jgi:hypothetical protein
MGYYEDTAKEFSGKRRLKKLAGIQEGKKPLSPEFKEKIDQLAIDSRKLLNGFKELNTKKQK